MIRRGHDYLTVCNTSHTGRLPCAYSASVNFVPTERVRAVFAVFIVPRFPARPVTGRSRFTTAEESADNFRTLSK
jgi:hypothetical protein